MNRNDHHDDHDRDDQEEYGDEPDGKFRFSWRIVAYVLIFLTLLLGTIYHKILPVEQRALRAQFREVLVLLSAKPPGPSASADKAAPTAVDRVALRRALGRRDVSELIRPFATVLRDYGRFASDENALRAYLDTFAIPHEEAKDAFDAAVSDAGLGHAALLARGIQRARLGWQARGGDYATRTPPHKFEAMTRWHALAVSDLVEYIRHSPRPTPAVVELLGIMRNYDHSALAAELFEAALRIDPRSTALFDEYLVHNDAKWGHKTVGDNRALIARARALKLGSPYIDQTERILDYMEEGGGGAYTRAVDAPARAERYTKAHETYDAWMWRGNVERDHMRPVLAMAAFEHAMHLRPEALEPAEQRVYLLELAGRLDEARAEYSRLIALGSDYAQNRIIRAHIWGELGYTRDWPAIRGLCEDSATMLNRAGEACVGGLHFDALAGYPRDSNAAVRWFRRAAERQHPSAQHDFGWMLVNGMGGVGKDYAEGVYWLRQSSQNGFDMANEKLKQLGEPVEPWTHTWWRIESGLKGHVAPLVWKILDRVPAF